MLTRCPQCESCFRVQTGQLEAATGLVRCGNCEHVFNAFDSLFKEPDSLLQSGLRQADLGSSRDIRLTSSTHKLVEPELPPNPLRLSAEQIINDSGHYGVSAAFWGWLLGCAMMVGVFMVELKLVDPGAINNSGWLHSIVANSCELLGCPVPARKAPDQVRVLSRSINLHPDRKDALRLQVSFTNAADFRQPPPHMVVALLDKNDKTVARRTFGVNEYSTETVSVVEPGQRIQSRLDILDPGGHAVGFRIEFL